MRHPLALPAGSVRAILALSLIWTVCALTAYVVVANRTDPIVTAALAGISGMAGSVLTHYFKSRETETMKGGPDA